ncbi:MAG TPA: Hsp20/alpha crystallin family protein [Gaiellaceae bacterium]|nr:Hsp20/alpha crystallin family protein [Gaiellaceae bacterium]
MATLVRWDPLRELAQWQNDVERLMGTFLRGTGNGDTRWAPPLDVWETDQELVYAFDLPGIPEDKISIEFDEGSLTVSAERERTEEVSKDRVYRFERRYGSFSRTIGLPQGVTEKDIRADYENGVLEVHVTKPKVPEPRRIQIGKGEKATIEGKASKS